MILLKAGKQLLGRKKRRCGVGVNADARLDYDPTNVTTCFQLRQCHYKHCKYVGQFRRILHSHLFLLCHKLLRRDGPAIGALQRGHRGRLLTSAPISRRRMVAIEFGM